MRLHAAALAAAGLLMLGAAGCASVNPVDQPGSGGSAGGSGTAVPTGTSNPSDTTTGPSMGGPASSPMPTSSVQRAAAAGCPTDAVTPLTNPHARVVPPDIQVAWVLRCRVVPGYRARVLIAERSTSDPTDLVRALRQASVPRQKVVCPMIAVYIPNFALVQADGQLLVPRIPLNNCGMPQEAVAAALNQLTFVQISSRSLN